MKLYHGTNIDFDKIDISKSKPNKDFGCGFYLSFANVSQETKIYEGYNYSVLLWNRACY